MTAVERRTAIAAGPLMASRCGVTTPAKGFRRATALVITPSQATPMTACAHFVRHRERNNYQQTGHPRTTVSQPFKGFSDPNPDQQKAKPPRLSINQIELARCTPKPPTPFIEDGAKRVFNDVEHQLVATWEHSKTQYVERWDGPEGKKLYRPHHRSSNGVWLLGGGELPWGVYCRTLAELIKGKFVIEFEGEKSSEIAEGEGYIAISQPGHAHSVGLIVDRYRALVELAARGSSTSPTTTKPETERLRLAVKPRPMCHCHSSSSEQPPSPQGSRPKAQSMTLTIPPTSSPEPSSWQWQKS